MTYESECFSGRTGVERSGPIERPALFQRNSGPSGCAVRRLRIAFVVLPTNTLSLLLSMFPAIACAVADAVPGSYVESGKP